MRTKSLPVFEHDIGDTLQYTDFDVRPTRRRCSWPIDSVREVQNGLTILDGFLKIGPSGRGLF